MSKTKKILLFFIFLHVVVISNAQNYQGKIDSLIRVSEVAGDDTNKINVMNLLSQTFFSLGDFEKAMTYANEELELSKKIGLKKSVARSHNQLGLICANQCNFLGEIENGIAALEIEEEINDKQGMAVSYTIIGHSYLQRNNISKAFQNYMTSLKIQESINDKQGIITSYNNIGESYFNKGDLQEALKNYSVGFKMAREIGDKNAIFTSNLCIGAICQKEGKYDESEKYYLTAFKMAEEKGDMMGIANCYITLGQLFIKQHKFSEARDYLTKGLNLSRKIGRESGLAEGYFHLSVLDSIIGNYEEAYRYYMLSTRHRDSILNEATNRQISQLTIQYETEKKDQQLKTKDLENKNLQTRIYYGMAIGLIILGIVILLFYLRSKRKKQEYEHALTDLELTVLKAQLNPHFIANSLSTIKWFFDRQPERASQFLAKFAKLMRRILEQSELPFISLNEELETAELYMHIESLRLKNGFDYHIECESSIDLNLTIVPPLILQPSIENAIRHGLVPKKERGKINIDIKIENGLLKFIVEDNGVGNKYIKAGQNAEFWNNKSFGLAITRKRISMLSKQFNKEGYLDLRFLKEATVTEIAFPVN